MPDDRTVAAVTVGQLVASPVLRDAAVLGGTGGLGNLVEDVVVSSARDRPDADPAVVDRIVVLDASEHRFDTYLIDMALRAAHQSGASALLLCAPPSPPTLAAVRLADKLRLPLVVSPATDPLVLTDELRRLVRAPHIVRSQVMLGAIGDLQRTPHSAGLDAALATLGRYLDGPVALLGPGGAVLAGDRGDGAVLDGLADRHTVRRDGRWTDVVQPIHLAPGERAAFWLACRLEEPSADWQALASDTLRIACWYVATRLVADRLERERDARFRLGVLNAIVATADRPDAALLEQLGVLGWQVEGWCTAIHVIASGDMDPVAVLTRTDELRHRLGGAGIQPAIVERPDGWSLWLADPTEPPASAYRELTQRVRSAASRFLERTPRSHLHVGIGRPYPGISGLRASLAEAQEAATIARAGGEAFVVRHIDEMGLRRILLGWYASESFAELARTLLGPVLAVDNEDGELIETLETYLDCESSATAAAARLALHRNTVINRIERVRSLLTVDLDDPDERLAVQLACRVLKLGQGAAGVGH